MAEWLPKMTTTASKTLNIVKSVGPLIVSQFDSASGNIARHQARLANVDAATQFVKAEIETLTGVRRTLMERWVDADPHERLRIQQDLEFLSGNMSQLNIAVKAIEYTPRDSSPSDTSPTPEAHAGQPEISAHWLDKFRELAKARNEPWRENLLARALAVESSDPGTVSPRALWLIGTLEESLFHAFATILDLSTWVGGGLMIPKSENEVFTRPIPNCPLGQDATIGRLTFQLSDIAVLGETLTVTRTFPEGSRFLAKYGDAAYSIDCRNSELTIRGTIPTNLGSSIASFCEPRFNPLGKELFETWIESIDKAQYSVQKVSA